MPRTPWTPDTATPAQREALKLARDRAQAASRAEDEAWATIHGAHTLGVPLAYAAEQAGWRRSTVIRRVKNPNAVMWTGHNLAEVQAVRPDARLNDDGDLVVDHADGTGPVIVGINYVLHRPD